METAGKLIVAALSVWIAWVLAAGDAGPSLQRATQPPAAPIASPGSDQAYHGMAIQLHGGTDVYDRYARLIPEIAALGADTVLMVVHGWQEHAGSLDLHIDARKTADPRQLGRLVDLARRHGLRTILMPIVLLDHPRGSEWRGKIIPPSHDWDEWFRRYTRFILHFAKVAERHSVDVYMVGSELLKTETYTDRWKRLIQDVRQEYRGKLGYSANWDHYQTDKIGFWPQLDLVGMTSYYELASGPNPVPAEIDKNWEKIKTNILAFQREVGKPIVFTEVGWCSQEGAAHEGWNYYANQKATPKGMDEQKRLYEAFLRAWDNQPGIGGVIWWEWDVSEGGPSDYNYTPRGKPAEKVLRDWFASKAPPPVADQLKNADKESGPRAASR